MRASLSPHLLLASVASASILESYGFGIVESQGLLRKHAELLRRQADNNATCRFSMPTDIWTTCAGFLSEFNITLDYFRIANPSIGPSCADFEPGTTYCVSMGSSIWEGCAYLYERNVRYPAELDQHMYREPVG
ncbi:Uu.00g117540.m01.CDS01 [Anthostomella pinea]|uniref:Uu.00g117540.m01.CDS01 n=1 Tax=Anthostomella pinea TaxID=933095 RepID=A0AAI8VH72_9PEZI|nr:Uu.00g117540.m01.CDS01 [Anthostomella pinea]